MCERGALRGIAPFEASQGAMHLRVRGAMHLRVRGSEAAPNSPHAEVPAHLRASKHPPRVPLLTALSNIAPSPTTPSRRCRTPPAKKEAEGESLHFSLGPLAGGVRQSREGVFPQAPYLPNNRSISASFNSINVGRPWLHCPAFGVTSISRRSAFISSGRNTRPDLTEW